MMRRTEQNMDNPVSCSQCGDSTAPLHLDHRIPTFAEDIAKGSRWEPRGPAPAFGPEGLMVLNQNENDTDPNVADWNKLLASLPVGELVKLWFPVTSKKFRWLPAEIRAELTRFECEPMWVRITAVYGSHPEVTYEGELCGIPLLIHPKKLQWGSRVTFAPKHIHQLDTCCDHAAGSEVVF